MSKGGGAGKVYFVLYLAVVLELLIIIVERDEAEEGLHKKQKETMKIVESILAQLQTGAGTEGMNTRPQDEITIFDEATKAQLGKNQISTSRRYTVEVGVTDVRSEISRRLGENDMDYTKRLKRLIAANNVEEIEYQIFYNGSDDVIKVPMFPSEDTIKRLNYDFAKFQPGQRISASDGSEWTFLQDIKLKLDQEAVFNKIANYNNVSFSDLEPIYPNDADHRTIVGPSNGYEPNNRPDSAFYYSTEKSLSGNGASASAKKRAFEVNFKPDDKPGWYKLRFSSRTNKILGVRKEHSTAAQIEPSDETPISIGVVQLTVMDLKKVKKELSAKLSEYSLPNEDVLKDDGVIRFDELLTEAEKRVETKEDRTELQQKIQLYGYIVKLLTPGQYTNLSQNLGSIEFNIRVNKPNIPTGKPEVTLWVYPQFDAVNPVFEMKVSPYQGSLGDISVKYTTPDGERSVPSTNMQVMSTDQQGVGKASAAVIRITIPELLKGGEGQAMEYPIVASFRYGGELKSAEDRLLVFKTGLEDARRTELFLKDEALYGSYISQRSLKALSGNKIAGDRFRIVFDNGTKADTIPGLNIPFNAFYFPENAVKAEIKVIWMQPFTGTDVELFKGQYDVNLDKPRIGLTRMDQKTKRSTSGSTGEITVDLSNISITKPRSGVLQGDEYLEPDVTVTVSDIKIQGASFTVKQSPSKPKGTPKTAESNVYSTTFKISGEIPENSIAYGTITVKIVAKVTKGLKTEVSEKTQVIKINERFEEEY